MSELKDLLTEVNERVNGVDLTDFDLDELPPRELGEVIVGEADEALLRLHLAEISIQHEIAEALSEVSDINLNDSLEEVAVQALQVPTEKQDSIRRVIQEIVPLNDALEILFTMSVARKFKLDPNSKYYIRKGGAVVLVVPQTRD